MAAEASVVHRALDGRRFRLAGSLDLGQPFTSVVEVRLGGRGYELTAGPLGLDEEIASAVGVPGLDEELSYRGGVLRIGRASRYDGGIRLVENLLVAAWQGRRYCLVTQLYRASSADALVLMRGLGITEHEDGLSLAPGGGAVFGGPASVIKRVPRFGLLELSPLTAELASRLPRWQGVATTAGELFRDDLGDGSPYFVLAGRDTWATLVPLADTAVDEVAALADRLDVQTVG